MRNSAAPELQAARLNTTAMRQRRLYAALADRGVRLAAERAGIPVPPLVYGLGAISAQVQETWDGFEEWYLGDDLGTDDAAGAIRRPHSVMRLTLTAR